MNTEENRMLYVNILVLTLAQVRSLSAYTSCETRYDVQDMCDVSYGVELSSKTVKSLLGCLTYCEGDVKLCRSAVYNPTSRTCVTNKEETPNVTTGCSGPAKYLTIQQSSCRKMVGDNCTTNEDCFPRFSICAGSTCGCKFGYNPNTDTGMCDIDCETYGNTYRESMDMKMTDWDEETILFSSATSCKSDCNIRPTCRTASFTLVGFICHLTTLTIGGNPSNYQVLLGWTTFHRECA